ncbi:MAG: hypothetical protein Q7T61_18970 [Caulobacter sp.]|nr:hypothetical protein [Caulobacter sp.]
MFLPLIALLAVAQPADTYRSEACAHDPRKGMLAELEILESHKDETIWRLTKDGYRPFDAKTLIRGKGKAFASATTPVVLNGKSFERYGLPRVIHANELEARPFAMFDGVPFYSEKGATDIQVLYALHEPVGCQFQPYQLRR